MISSCRAAARYVARRARCFEQASDAQALVEFALVLPVLMLVIFGVLEWAFLENALTTTNLASRDGALLAAEGGSTAGIDCMVLQRIERGMVVPTRRQQIQQIVIYWSNANGAQIGTNQNVYTRSGSFTCTLSTGTTITVPYTRSVNNYPESVRCNVLAGCASPHTSLDTIGVTVTYQHQWATPFGSFIAPSFAFTRSTAVRMEPQV
jgi:Flp pilus assembly protein TadG